jgi:hypothetical protein
MTSPIAAPRSRSRSCLDDLQHRHGGGARDRVADVGAADLRVAGSVHDRGPADDAGDRQPGAHRLGDGDQVGLDAEVLHGEHAAGATVATLDLVGDQHDAVLVAERAEALEVGREAGTKPPSPWTGSMMTAATASGATRVVKARRRSASAISAASGPRRRSFGNSTR